MSNTQVATLSSIQDRLRDRIQTQFVDMIPPELWEGLVAKHLKEVTDEMLPKIVKEEAEKRLRTMVQTEMNKPEWREIWDNQSSTLGPRASEMAKKIMRECADDLVGALFGRLAQGIVIDIRNGIQRF